VLIVANYPFVSDLDTTDFISVILTVLYLPYFPFPDCLDCDDAWLLFDDRLLEILDLLDILLLGLRSWGGVEILDLVLNSVILSYFDSVFEISLVLFEKLTLKRFCLLEVFRFLFFCQLSGIYLHIVSYILE